jgi:hypothetical protein
VMCRRTRSVSAIADGRVPSSGQQGWQNCSARLSSGCAFAHENPPAPHSFGLGGVDAIHVAIDCSSTGVLVVTRIEIEYHHEATTTTSALMAGSDSACSMCLYVCLCLPPKQTLTLFYQPQHHSANAHASATAQSFP